MAVRLSALRTSHILLPRNIIFLFLILIFVRGWANSRVMVWLEGLCKLKKFIHLVRSWTRDLWACSIVPQPLRYSVPSKPDNLQKIIRNQLYVYIFILRNCDIQGIHYIHHSSQNRSNSPAFAWKKWETLKTKLLLNRLLLHYTAW
jgi:hypothetical protein